MNPSIIGDNASAASLIPSEDLRQEPGLDEVKWLDYRYLSVTDATRFFGAEYLKIYQEKWNWWSSTSGNPEDQFPVRERIFDNDPRILVGLWKARQFADLLGAPYSTFIRHAFTYCLDNGYKRPPAPSQLYGPKVMDYVLRRWGEWVKEYGRLVQFVEDRRFLNEHFRGDLPQNAFHQLRIDRLRPKTGRDLIDALGMDIYDHAWLPIEKAREVFGDVIVDQAKSQSSSVYRPEEGTNDDYLRSCFGLPHAYDATNPICIACPFTTKCPLAVDEALNLMLDIHGESDPRAQRKREKARVRKRRERERRRLESKATPDA